VGGEQEGGSAAGEKNVKIKKTTYGNQKKWREYWGGIPISKFKKGHKRGMIRREEFG